MLAEGYGKFLGRLGLDLKERELCIAVTLSGIDAGPQLYSHLRGSLQVGAEPAEVEAALEIATRVIAPDRKSTRLNSCHVAISYAVSCLQKHAARRRFRRTSPGD